MRPTLMVILLSVVSASGCAQTLEDPDDGFRLEDSGYADVHPDLIHDLGQRGDALEVLLPQAVEEARADERVTRRGLLLWVAQRDRRVPREEGGLPGEVLEVAASCLRSRHQELRRCAERTLGYLADARCFGVLVEHLGRAVESRDRAAAVGTLAALQQLGEAHRELTKTGSGAWREPWLRIELQVYSPPGVASLDGPEQARWCDLVDTHAYLALWLVEVEHELPSGSRAP